MSTASQLKVAIQGERGAFSHAAAVAALGKEVEILPRPSFEALFEAAVSGAADRALVPIENSLARLDPRELRPPAPSPLHIVGETQLRVEQCLITRPGASACHA